MTKVTSKQLKRLVNYLSAYNLDELNEADLKVLICDEGLCPIKSCAFYNVKDVECPHLTQICALIQNYDSRQD